MAYMNQVNLMGVVLSQPHYYFDPEGRPNALFTLSTSMVYDVRGESRVSEQHHRVRLVGKRADALKDAAISVGDEIHVGGKIQYFQDPKDSKIVVAEIRGDVWQVLKLADPATV